MNFFLTLALTFFITLCFSQIEEYIEPTIVPDTYIGSFGNNDYYFSRQNLLYVNHNVSIISRENNQLINKGELVIEKDEKAIEIFIYKESFYVITEKLGSENVLFSVKTFNSSFNLVESNLLLEIDKTKKDKHEIYASMKGNLIGLVALSNSKKNNTGHSTVYDIVKNEKSSFEFEIDDLSYYTCLDYIFNDKLQIELILTFHDGSSLFAPNSKENTAVLVSCSNSKVKTNVLKVKGENTLCKSFKFCQIDNDNYLLGSLVFSRSDGKNIVGYSVLKNHFGNNEISELEIIINDQLDNPNLWTKRDYKRWLNDSYISSSADQVLKNIIYLSNDNYIFVSEAQTSSGSGEMVGPSNTNSVGTPSSSSIGASTSIISSDFSNADISGDLLVSRIDLISKKVKWSNQTVQRFSYINIHVANKPLQSNYLFSINSNKIHLYYNCSEKSFNEKGEFDREQRPSAYSIETIADFSCNLTTGEGNIQLMSKSSKIPLEKVFLSSAKVIDGKIESFIGYHWDKIIALMFDVEKIRFIDLQ